MRRSSKTAPAPPVKKESGQVLAEYAVMIIMTGAVALMLLVFMAAFSEYGWRILGFVGWELTGGGE